MQIKTYTHKEIEFEHLGGLDVRLPNMFVYLKRQINNGSLSWRLNRTTWLSVKQLKEIIKKNK
jgi:hypothetical protein